MSCQMIRARDWDQMTQSGRVRGVVPPGPQALASVEPPLPECGPDLREQSDAELLLLLDRVRGAERQLWALVAELTAELARRTASRPDDRTGAVPVPPA